MKHRSWRFLLLILVILAALAAGGYWFWNRPAPEPTVEHLSQADGSTLTKVTPGQTARAQVVIATPAEEALTDAQLSALSRGGKAQLVQVILPKEDCTLQQQARLLKRKTHRHGLGLVVGLLGQPAPGQGCARADAANQRRRAFQLLQCRLQGLLLQGAVFLGQNDLYQLRLAATAQRRELSVGQGLFGRCCNHHLGARGLARCHFGQGRAIGLAQVLNRRLRGRASSSRLGDERPYWSRVTRGPTSRG